MDITDFPGDVGWWFWPEPGCSGPYEPRSSVSFKKDPGHNDRGSFTRGAPYMDKGRWVAAGRTVLLKLNPPNPLIMTGQIGIEGLTVSGIFANFESDSLGCIFMIRKDASIPDVKMPEE